MHQGGNILAFQGLLGFDEPGRYQLAFPAIAKASSTACSRSRSVWSTKSRGKADLPLQPPRKGFAL